MAKLTALIGRIVLVLLVAALVAGGWAYYKLSQPYKGFQGDLFVEIERGSGTRAIAAQLAKAGVIEAEWPFLLMRGVRKSANLQAGEYQFKSAASVREVFDRLARGDIYYFDVTIPEGSNIWEIARLLESSGIAKEEEFLKAAADPSLIRDLVPEARSLEGYLFPSTYRISHRTTAKELCAMMVAEFRKQWKSLAPEGAGDSAANLSEKPGPAIGGPPNPVQRVVTLASLVEKETSVATERPVVAGVFTNRLKIGMPLACDPTVIYAALLEGKYRGTIYRSDLDREHPYNTYKVRGLPPGPIANPGRASLEAALKPADTDYLFFVAKPEGGSHTFSSTGAAHERAVAAYRHGAASQ